MPDNKKEQEREELHRAIWAIADDLRGSVDGWDFKSYVLGIMFYRYISENLTNYIISVHRNHPPVARPVNPSAIRFLVCGLCCGCVVSAC